MDFEYYFEKFLSYYNVNSLKDLSEITNIPISTISSFKQRNSITALKKKCRELGIYKEIFDDNSQEISKKSDEIESENKSDLSKYFTALQSVAIATNKEDELLTDIRELIKKYMQ